VIGYEHRDWREGRIGHQRYAPHASAMLGDEARSMTIIRDPAR
jgi:hypothetical protein